jgi:apolipoprotein N-acyltransferase
VTTLRSHPRDWLAAILAGVFYSLSFAPGPLPQLLLPAVQLIVLAWLARATLYAPSARHAAWRGWFFGLGAFTVGLYWLTISMSRYGGMPWALSVAALVLLSAYLALFPALALWFTRLLSQSYTPLRVTLTAVITAAVKPNDLTDQLSASESTTSTPTTHDASTPSQNRIAVPTLAFIFIWASSWTLAEWLRGTLFTGFPWLNTAYGQVDSWLSAWSILGGTYGVVWVTALMAAALMATVDLKGSIKKFAPIIVVVVAIGGALLGTLQLTQPFGEPLRVRLIQGSIDQGEKFTPSQWRSAVQRYLDLAQHQLPDQTITPQLIMMPETMMVKFPQDVEPAVWQSLIDIAQKDQATILLGSPLLNTQTRQYTNSIIAITGQQTPEQLVLSSKGLLNGNPAGISRYDKQHLVPFGEFVPLGFRWFVDLMHIPLGDFTSGVAPQMPFAVGQQRIAANICYEDIFGEELLAPIRSQADPSQGATILANFSNLGWFGDTWALRQHWQMARLRAVETSRPVVRATNTGMTGAIDHYGRTVAFLKPMQGGYLDVTVQGQAGMTPYTVWGDLPVLMLAGFILLGAGFSTFRRHPKQNTRHDTST